MHLGSSMPLNWEHAQVELEDPATATALQAIKAALDKAETHNPGLAHELVDAIVEIEQVKGGIDSTEKFLLASTRDFPEYEVPPKVRLFF